MGGHAAGELASQEACLAIIEAPGDALADGSAAHVRARAIFNALTQANQRVLAKRLASASLRYGAFRRRGPPIGGGAVESSVRRVINLRLNGSSTLWTEEHAEGVLHLRGQAKSGRWRDFEKQVLAITG